MESYEYNEFNEALNERRKERLMNKAIDRQLDIEEQTFADQNRISQEFMAIGQELGISHEDLQALGQDEETRKVLQDVQRETLRTYLKTAKGLKDRKNGKAQRSTQQPQVSWPSYKPEKKSNAKLEDLRSKRDSGQILSDDDLADALSDLLGGRLV